MAGHSVTVGNVELVSVSDGFPIRSPMMPFPDTTIEQWREFPGLVDDNDQVSSRYGSLVVRSGGKLILVDTGLQAADGILLEDMKNKGVDREEVDLVVFTHLHPDHVGWNLVDGKPTFPKARYPDTANRLGLLDRPHRDAKRRAHRQPSASPAGPERDGPHRRGRVPNYR